MERKRPNKECTMFAVRITYTHTHTPGLKSKRALSMALNFDVCSFYSFAAAVAYRWKILLPMEMEIPSNKSWGKNAIRMEENKKRMKADNNRVKKNKHIYAQLAYSYNEIYILDAWTLNGKQCTYILLQIFWMADNNKIDIVQYTQARGSLHFFFILKYCVRSLTCTLICTQISKQMNERMTCTHI